VCQAVTPNSASPGWFSVEPLLFVAALRQIQPLLNSREGGLCVPAQSEAEFFVALNESTREHYGGWVPSAPPCGADDRLPRETVDPPWSGWLSLGSNPRRTD